MAEFNWEAGVDVGIGLLGGISKGLGALGAAEISKSNARAANLIREGQNMVRRANRGLAATVMNINYKRTMEAAEDQLDSATINTVRTADAFVRSKFEDSIKGAEAMGRAAVKARSGGMGGSGIEAISQVTSLQLARSAQIKEDQEAAALYDSASSGNSIISNAFRSVQTSSSAGGFDFGKNQASSPNIASALINGLLSKKDSLQTALGSLAPDKQSAGGDGAFLGSYEDMAPASSVAQFAFEQPGADTFAVNQSSVTGVDLGPITMN